jgi:hypothetical protein
MSPTSQKAICVELAALDRHSRRLIRQSPGFDPRPDQDGLATACWTPDHYHAAGVRPRTGAETTGRAALARVP